MAGTNIQTRGGHMYRNSEPLSDCATMQSYIRATIIATQDKDKAKRVHHAKGNFTFHYYYHMVLVLALIC